jgi:hypothetical protein
VRGEGGRLTRHLFPAAAIGTTFSTSSPKWLMTFTAIFPVVGGSNGWLVARYSFSHSASSISARSAFFSFAYGSSAPRK